MKAKNYCPEFEEYKTIRQWAFLGQLPKKDAKGVAVLNLLLKRAERDEQAMMTTLAGLIVVLLMIVRQIGNLFETIKEVFGLY